MGKSVLVERIKRVMMNQPKSNHFMVGAAGANKKICSSSHRVAGTEIAADILKRYKDIINTIVTKVIITVMKENWLK